MADRFQPNVDYVTALEGNVGVIECSQYELSVFIDQDFLVSIAMSLAG